MNRKDRGSDRQGLGQTQYRGPGWEGHAGCVVLKGPQSGGQAGRPGRGSHPGQRCEAPGRDWQGLEGVGGREPHKPWPHCTWHAVLSKSLLHG